MKEEFTPAEEKEFIRLLKKIQANNYWVPSGVWEETLRTFPRYALELVIVDPEKTPSILLTRYTGDTMPAHKGHFHIPGGFALPNESIEETCSRIAKGELGVDVRFQGILGVHKWTADESPNGALPLSLYTSCKPLNDITLNENCHFFTREEMLALGANDMIQNHPHRAFISHYLAKIESGTSIVPIMLER
ncbi:NUDIX hydrolase [Candidatus Kaiserbacteria bacterium]|nr:NUDIX hydrolase [Candidatus Kaiserbacteria bacterium]